MQTMKVARHVCNLLIVKQFDLRFSLNGLQFQLFFNCKNYFEEHIILFLFIYYKVYIINQKVLALSSVSNRVSLFKFKYDITNAIVELKVGTPTFGHFQ